MPSDFQAKRLRVLSKVKGAKSGSIILVDGLKGYLISNLSGFSSFNKFFEFTKAEC